MTYLDPNHRSADLQSAGARRSVAARPVSGARRVEVGDTAQTGSRCSDAFGAEESAPAASDPVPVLAAI